MRIIKTLIVTAFAAALLVVPAGALASKRDRDHDRMADKWEHANHLNTRANDARKDPDHDGLSNLAEFRHGTNPRAADTDRDGINDGTEVRDDMNPRSDDSDNDGVRDGDEVSGTITSFENGVLTIQLAGTGAGTVSGTVDDMTRIECDDDAAPTATTSSDGSGDNSGPGSDDHSGSGSGDNTTSSGTGSDDGAAAPGAGDDDGANQGADDDQSEDNTCTTADLKPGARVHEAKLTTAMDGSSSFTKIELVPAAPAA
jgi:hypothetical protein